MMRCGCPECGSYMVQSEGLGLSCVCQACGYRCSACLGTDTVISKDDLKKYAENMPFAHTSENEDK